MMRLNDHGGLACTASTWGLVAALVVAWLVVPRLVLARRGGWRAMPISLLGLAWFGFGIDFVVRFFLLAYDSVEFGNDTFRLADLPSATVDRALAMALVYWACVVGAFACWGRLESAGVFTAVDVLGGRGRAPRRWALLAGATACAVAAAGPFHVPLPLVTPLAIVGSLWLIPATLLWADHVAGRSRHAPWLALAPAVLHFAVSPFREHLVPLVLVPLVARLGVHGRLPRRHLLAGAVALPLFVLAGTVTQAYRDVLWGGAPVSHVVDAVAGPEDELEEPDPAWLVAIRRFHGLDSLLLTVDLVPAAFPFREDAVLVDAFVRGLVPRVLLPSKTLSDRGPEFARTIWAYDSGLASEAAIAPSMPGDLYHAGGPATVALGALVWGLFLGLLDRWKDALSAGGRAAVLALLATQVIPSVERDFAHCVATLLQTLVVLGVVGAALGQVWRRRRQPRARGLVARESAA